MLLSDEQYRSELRAYSNSDLSELDRGGKPMTASADVLAFGTAFHSLILEPDTFDPVAVGLSFTEQQGDDLFNMRRAINNIPAIYSLIRRSRHETIRTWTDKQTGLPCKGKLDIDRNTTHLADLKTTSARTEAEFLADCHRHNYDRQAAFYLSSHPDSRFFEFIGVQKVYPYRVYRESFFITDPFIVGGQKKVARLMKRAKYMADMNLWTPSSWDKNRRATAAAES